MTDLDRLDAPTTEAGRNLADGLADCECGHPTATARIVAIEEEARVAAVRERDELREAAENVIDAWDHFESKHSLVDSLTVLRAALHHEDGAS